jgi:hypothetical protein
MTYMKPTLVLVADAHDVVLGSDPNGSDNLVTFITLPEASFGSLGLD